MAGALSVFRSQGLITYMTPTKYWCAPVKIWEAFHREVVGAALVIARGQIVPDKRQDDIPWTSLFGNLGE
jgi:hypothetical protein